MPEPTEQTTDKTTFKLRYHGRDVEDGTMAINNVTEGLEGFAGAYTKVGAFLNFPDVNLRVSTPQRGSFEIAVLASIIAQHQAQFQNIDQAWDFEYAAQALTRISHSRQAFYLITCRNRRVNECDGDITPSIGRE